MKDNLTFDVVLLATLACSSLALWGNRDTVKMTVTRDRVLKSLSYVTDEVYSEESVKKLFEGLPIELISHVQTEDGVHVKLKSNRNDAERFDDIVTDKLLYTLSKFPMAHDVIQIPDEGGVEKVTLEIQRSDVEFFFRLAYARIYSPVTIPTLILSNYQLALAMSKLPKILAESSGGVHGLVLGQSRLENVRFKRENLDFPSFMPEDGEDELYRFMGWLWSPAEGSRESFNVTLEREKVKRRISGLLWSRLASEENLRSTLNGTPFSLKSYEVIDDEAILGISVTRKGLEVAREAFADNLLETVSTTPFAKDVILQVPREKAVSYSKTITEMTVEIESDDLNTIFSFITRGMFDRNAAVPAVMANEKFAMAVKKNPEAAKWLADAVTTLWNIGDQPNTGNAVGFSENAAT